MDLTPSPRGASIDRVPAWNAMTDTGPHRHQVLRAVVALVLCFAGAIKSANAAGSAASVDATRIVAADQDPANWMTYGRTYSEQRFSPLARITADNAKQLGLAWYADLDTNRGQEATPLVIDGVLYVSTAWSMVKAYNAKTGALLWSYDPAVARALGVRGCCDVVNRGVAAWKGKIFVGTFDGRLVALDARTGTPVWTVMTVDPSKPYTITQAPRVIKGRVVIGNSGSEYGVRGYISAYDAETGGASLALLYRARRPCAASGKADSRRSRQDLGWGLVEAWWRRRRLGKHLL
jgi:quinohemoprotein ethanol dehydrogenase